MALTMLFGAMSELRICLACRVRAASVIQRSISFFNYTRHGQSVSKRFATTASDCKLRAGTTAQATNHVEIVAVPVASVRAFANNFFARTVFVDFQALQAFNSGHFERIVGVLRCGAVSVFFSFTVLFSAQHAIVIVCHHWHGHFRRFHWIFPDEKLVLNSRSLLGRERR